MWAYILLIVSSILALIGASLNTEIEGRGKKPIFKKPNKAGVVVLMLLIFSSLGQLKVQWDKSEEDNRNLEKAEKKIESDSLKYLESYKLLQKSYEMVTNSYNEQIKMLTTSNNILTGTDSILGRTKKISDNLISNFETNFEKFDEQLNRQSQTINSIEQLQYPIYPFKIDIVLQTDVSRIDQSKKDDIINYINAIRKLTPKPDMQSFDLVEDGDNSYLYFSSKYNENWSKIPQYNSVNSFIINKIIPRIYLYFFKKAQINEINYDNSDLFFNIKVRTNEKKSTDRKIDIEYQYFYNVGIIYIFLHYESQKQENDKRIITSIYSIKNGFLAIEPVDELGVTNFDSGYITTGNGYIFSLDRNETVEEKIIKSKYIDRNIYIELGKSILK